MLTDDQIDAIGFGLEAEGLSHSEIDDYFLQHYGKKGMKWGVRRTVAGRKGAHNTSATNKGYANGFSRGTTSTQSRASRNGKRVAATLLVGPVGLIGYNMVAAPLSAKDAASGKKATPQSKKAFAGKAVAATLLGGPWGTAAYVQVARQVK